MIDRAERFADLDEPQKRGHATEAVFRATFALLDVPLLIPTSDNEPYDMVVEIADRFQRIQCKTAYQKSPGTVAFETVSTRRRGDGYDRRGYDGRAELFAVYDPVNDYRYLVPVEDAATGKMEIRFEEAKNGQQIGVNWYEDYLFSEQIDELQDSYNVGRNR